MCVCVCVSGETGMCLEGEMCVSESVGTDSGMWRERRWGVEKEATWIFMSIYQSTGNQLFEINQSALHISSLIHLKLLHF